MTTSFDRLAAALSDRYRIKREIGAGGMATVYLAEDVKHRREVAVKVLRSDLAASLGAERFLREIEVAARLQHPNILPLFDSGSATVGRRGSRVTGPEGSSDLGAEETRDPGPATFLYYVMPYVEGESLRARLSHGGELPIHDVVRILSEVADALAYAHGRGVVHRDIKPDNVMLSGRHALVMDFGVAKALSEATGRQSITTVGVALGTPAYMAPEQAAAEENIDHRADIYALGVMGYELLTGRPPFTGMSAQQVLAAQVTQTPVHLNERRAACPPALAAVVMRCLEKRPADRWQSAEEITRQLDAMVTPSGGMPPTSAVAATTAGAMPVPAAPVHRWQRAGYLALGIVIALGAAWGVMRKRPDGASASTAHRIAVLPFENLGDTTRLYFANGVTEAITTQLTGIGGLSVIPRATAARYRGTTKSITEIGQELGVGYVLTGTVQWEETAGHEAKVRVSPELVRVSDTSSVWAHGYDAVLTSVFQVYSDISTQVASALQVALDDPERQALARRPTENPEAYDLYLRAVDYSNRGLSKENFEFSIPMLQRAVALDPAFALAWGRLAEQLGLAHWLYIRRDDATITQAQAAAERALQLQPDLPEAHRAMGSVWYRKREYNKALAEFAIVQRSQPNSADLLSSIGFVERRQGKWEAALAHLQRARDLDPGSAQGLSQLGETDGILHRYDDAAALFHRGMELAPGEPDSYYFLMMTLICQSGDTVAARAVVRQAISHFRPSKLLVGTGRPFGWLIAGDEVLRRQYLPDLAAAQDPTNDHMYALRADILRGSGDSAGAHILYDSARVVLEHKLSLLPDDYGYHADLSRVDAFLGRGDRAISEAQRAIALLPPERDSYFGVENVFSLARVYAILGQAAPAVGQLKVALSHQTVISPAYLRLDTDFARIRNDPGFQQLLASTR